MDFYEDDRLSFSLRSLNIFVERDLWYQGNLIITRCLQICPNSKLIKRDILYLSPYARINIIKIQYVALKDTLLDQLND